MNDWQTVVEDAASADREAPEVPEEVRRRMADDRWRFRDYVIVRQVGEGPIGRVFWAWSLPETRAVALKLLHADRTTPAMVERFFKEVRSASRLQHSNVVRIHRVGRHAGLTFLESEFVDGESLQAMLQRGEAFAAVPAVKLVVDAARAVQAAHAAGLTHGDLKPSNVLVRDGHAKVTDFGMWRVREDAADAREPAADVRSLGTLLERLVGQHGAPELRPLVRGACEGTVSTAQFVEGLERRLFAGA